MLSLSLDTYVPCMGVASGWAGRVSAQPLFHWPNLHIYTLNYVVELKIVATSRFTKPKKLPKATLHLGCAIYSNFVILVGIPSL